MDAMDRGFSITQRVGSLKKEIVGGFIASIILVNPIILGDPNGASMNVQAVFVPTVIASVVATIIMGLWSNYPLGFGSFHNPNVVIFILTMLRVIHYRLFHKSFSQITKDEIDGGEDRVYFADVAGTFVGTSLGTSNITTYIESVAGVDAGARTGLLSVVASLLFLLSIFISTFTG